MLTQIYTWHLESYFSKPNNKCLVLAPTAQVKVLTNLLNFKSICLFSLLVLFHLRIRQIFIDCLLGVRYVLNTKDMTVNHIDVVCSPTELTFCED